jgi:hypothetical protein
VGSYLPSLIGYQTVTLPFPVAGKSAAVSASFGQLSLPVAPGKSAGVSASFGTMSLTPVGASQIGYATTTLSDPSLPVAGLNPAVSTSFGRLGNGAARSQIGYQSATLVDPSSGPAAYGKSLVGYVTATLAGPHLAVTVMTAVGTVKKARVLTWDGTQLR